MLLKDLVLSVFLFYLFLHCIGSYFCLVCFFVNLVFVVVVVDYYDLTLHSIFPKNSFLKLGGTCPTQAV